MTTDAMSCDRFGDRLMDYLEQDVDVATRASIETHAAACADCGALLVDIRKLRVDAANLPELTPARDLWAGIADRIETPVVPIGAGVAGTPRAAAPRRRVRGWLNVALIAASLIGAAVLGYAARGDRQVVAGTTGAPGMDATRADSFPTQMIAKAPDAPAAGPESSPVRVDSAPETQPRMTQPVQAVRPAGVQLAAATLTADYDREIARLRLLIQQRRAQLDPVTVTVIERNLAVIDTAIAESRRAIANDPNSRFLLEILNQSLQAKVELMRTAALLPSRT